MASEQRTIRLLDDLAAGRTTRRGFVRRAAALGLSVPALGALGATPRRAGAAAQDQTTLNFLHSIPPETEQFWEETLLPPLLRGEPAVHHQRPELRDRERDHDPDPRPVGR